MLDWLLEGTIAIGGGTLLVREIVGNGFGIASALLGSQRSVMAWPVGIVGNLILFTVFVGGVLAKPQVHDLWGQAGRQVFFLAVSVYGWQRWRQRRERREAGDGRAIVPSWAGPHGLVELAGLAVIGMAVFYPTLRALGSWGPLSDAWILTGSILATYGMARGWIEFWLIWIAVDAVGVPLLVRAEYYPSAALYLAYGGFCLYGFIAWLRARRAETKTPSADVLT
ncbi:MAG TPA: nicotinamide riboside transporter PnuC [Nocardioidaceae bacterium]|nr:nicotinamide riboside transporter PnuC [Nocardioidaceae bacterium]